MFLCSFIMGFEMVDLTKLRKITKELEELDCENVSDYKEKE